MSRPFEFDPAGVAPSGEAVLRRQGIPDPEAASRGVRDLVADALVLFMDTARPVALIEEVPGEEFREIFQGEGRNDPETLLGGIYPNAEALALFALTMGPGVGGKIESLFEEDEFPLGTMLDAVASLAADNAVEACEARLHDALSGAGRLGPDGAVLGYSPGYCGWHVSGQRALFRRLRPDTIGIDLNDSFLMIPLKSVSGVLVAGPREIHRADTGHPFCRFCRTRTCEQRMRRLALA
jgi:hypothetical protein